MEGRKVDGNLPQLRVGDGRRDAERIGGGVSVKGEGQAECKER